MSTILKALQRLEDEKSADAERSLDERIVAHRPTPPPERRGLKIVAVAIGGLAVAALAFLFWSTREEPDAEVAMESPPPATAPAAAATTKVAAEKPRRKSSARPAPAARAQRDSSEVEISPVVEVVKQLDASPDDSADSAASAAAPKRAAAPTKAGAERPARRPNVRKPKPRVARAAAEPRPIPEQVADSDSPATPISGNSAPAKPAPEPPAAVEATAVAAKSAPAAASASIPAAIREPEKKIVQRAALPALSVQKTIWHPDADRRVAIVKLVDAEEVMRLKEGDAIGPLVVKTISPGSVLFNHDDVEIRYNVGS